MIGRPVFLCVVGCMIEPFETERDARRWAAAQTSQPFQVFEVTGVRECAERDYKFALVAAKEQELADLKKRLGV